MSALTSALTGLRVHQAFLDVIGNNLANANTPGYRGSRVTFSDLISQTIRPASSPTSNLGGKNPVQIGLGVRLHSVDLRTNQGILDDTGRPFDLGIQGEGFFILNDGSQNTYTRTGVFGVDRDRFMVDTASGFRVRNIDGEDIRLPIDEQMAAQQTSSIDLGGNLPAKVEGPLAEVLTTSSAFQEGTAAAITGTSAEPFTLTDGDSFTIAVDGGASQTVTINTADFTNIAAATAAEVAAAINAQTTGLTADGSSGSVVLTSDRTGEESSLKIDNVTGLPSTAIGLSTNLVRGTETTATAATELNDLSDNVVDYVNGDVIEVSGTDASGQPFAGSFTYGTDGTTLGELASFIDSLIPDAGASVDANGNLQVTADDTGPATLFVTLTNSGTGSTLFSAHGFATTTTGTGPDTQRTSIDVFDSAGLRHTLTLTFTRVDSTGWDLSVTTDNPDDVINDGQVDGIRFDSDGSFFAATGTGTGDLDIDIVFSGQSQGQTILLNFGESGSLNGVTQLGASGSLRVLSQDGFAAGDLVSMSVTADGVIDGFYSNGQSQELDQIAIATFANPAGLTRRGGSMFERSVNSGVAQPQAAGTGGAGVIFSGVLESSNVDTAEEFVRLIEAQRGFQANARVIRVTDELLAEVVNLV